MPDLSEIRLREDAPEVRWVLFIDGIPYAFTSDNGQGPGLGTLIGSGASSWIGLSETSIGGVETAGARTVLPGLELPRTIRKAVDLKSGDIEPNPVSFKLHDINGTLAGLFAKEKAFDILRERVGPGTSAVPSTALGQGGTTIGLHERNIGIERIGSSGERRLFPALPFSLVGFDHAVHQDQAPPDGLPIVKVSDEPIAWTGRMVTLYEVYRDPDDTTADASAWPTWDDQHAAGNLAWVGVLLGVRRVRGSTFEIQCHGTDALYRRQLGVRTSPRWLPITAELNLEAGVEDGFAVYFEAQRAPGSVPFLEVFNGSIFDRSITATTKQTLAAEIDGFVQDAYDGTSTNYVGGNGNLNTWAIGGSDMNAEVRVYDGSVTVKKADQSTDQARLVMVMAMHARAWRQLGFEPESQHFDVRADAPDDPRQIQFFEMTAGQNFGQGDLPGFDTGDAVPGDGYWAARFTSVAMGFNEDAANANEWDNDGQARIWEAKFQGEPFTIDLQGGQVVRLGGGVSPFIEGDLTVPHEELDVDGSTSERARFFALRGKVQRADGSEPEDTVQVVRCEWSEGNYGSINPGAGALPALLTRQFMDPRLFGFNHRKLDGLAYWTGTSSGEGLIEAVPLNAYAYRGTDSPEFASSLWSQILLSTGTSPGWSGLAHTDGANSPADVYDGIRYWGSDVHLADMGCAVPYQIVASQHDINEAFATVPGGWNTNFNRVRHAYIGPFLAQETLASIMRPRRLIWSLHGGVLGVTKLGIFSPTDADLTITENDLYPTEPGDPRSLMPEQLPSPVGQLDALNFRYAWDPAQAKTLLQVTGRARDADAGRRTGELEETFSDYGVIPWRDWGPFENPLFWESGFELLWAYEAAEFFADDHYAIVVNVSRPKGQDCEPGTKVVLSNPWPADNAGGYGIDNHVAVLSAVEIDTVTHARKTEAFVFAQQAQGVRHFGGCARIVEQAGAVITIADDQYGHGNAALSDGDGLTEPGYSTIGGNLVVRLLVRVGETWTIGSSTFEVLSYDEGTAQVTLNSAPPTDEEYADRWLLWGAYADQNPDEWPRSTFGVIVRDNLTHGAGNTVGRPFYP